MFLGVDGLHPAALRLLLFVCLSVDLDFYLPADGLEQSSEEWVDVVVFHVVYVAMMSSRVSRSPAHPHATASSTIGEEGVHDTVEVVEVFSLDAGLVSVQDAEELAYLFFAGLEVVNLLQQVVALKVLLVCHCV